LKSPTIPAKYKEDSAIRESSATGDHYFADGPRLKTDSERVRSCRPWGAAYLRAAYPNPERWGRRQTQPTPRNKLARPDHQKEKEDWMEGASPDTGNVACLGEGGGWKRQ